MDALKLIHESSMKKELPVVNVGDTVRVHVLIKEGDKVVTGVDIGVASISDGQGEANPFMPSPPGARKNAKK